MSPVVDVDADAAAAADNRQRRRNQNKSTRKERKFTSSNKTTNKHRSRTAHKRNESNDISSVANAARREMKDCNEHKKSPESDNASTNATDALPPFDGCRVEIVAGSAWTAPTKQDNSRSRRRKRGLCRRSLSQNASDGTISRGPLKQGGSDCRSARTLERSSTNYDVGLRATNMNTNTSAEGQQHPQEPATGEKKRIAAFFSDHNKDLIWLTNLVKTSNESCQDASDSEDTNGNNWDDCVFAGGRQFAEKTQWNQCKAATPEVKRSDPIEDRPLSERLSASLATEVAAVGVGSRDSHSRSIYLGHFFRYPRIPADSSSSTARCIATSSSSSGVVEGGCGGGGRSAKHSTSTCSTDCYDLNCSLSKTRLTKKSAPQQHSSSSLKLSIDNLKLMVEKNMIATFIGVYILVSLAVIVVLILPYIFNFTNNQPQSDSSQAAPSSLSASMTNDLSGSTSHIDSGQPSASYQRLQGPDERQTHATGTGSHKTEDKGTQTVVPGVVSEQLYSQVAAPDRERTVRTTPTSSERRNTSAQMVPLVGGVVTTEAPPSTTMAAVATSGRPVSESEDDADLSRQTSFSDTATASKGLESAGSGGSRFNALWTAKHTGQQCQPMKVPFCSKTLGSILSDTGVPLKGIRWADDTARLSRMAYDKTLLPNEFTRARQSQIERTLQKYEPIIDIKCYALMPLFLCSIYAPKCVHQMTANPDIRSPQWPSASSEPLTTGTSVHSSSSIEHAAGGTQSSNDRQPRRKLSPVDDTPTAAMSINGSMVAARLIPPCRSLCREAFRKCMFFFEVLSLKLLELKDCDSLPESSDASVCVGQLENELLQRVTGSQNCAEDKFRCTDGECISKKWRCDGFNDCTDKSDELNCSKCSAQTQFYCGQEVCINKEQVCNGIRDCRDGRDERQCLRLSPVARATGSGTLIRRQQQLQAWSAVKEQWVPVCGAHWSAMPMSHQACQALGYSRANETLIVYGSSVRVAGAPDEIPMMALTRSNISQLLPIKAKLAPSRTRISRSAVGPSRKERQIFVVRDRRSPGGWFDVSSGDTFRESAGSTAPQSQEEADEQMASIVEDVASSESSATRGSSAALPSNLDLLHRADHLVHYELLAEAQVTSRQTIKGNGAGGQSAERSSIGGVRQPTTMTALDLAALDAAGIKLKSLTSMLYYGPEAGCAGRPSQLVSSVYLQCLNFQCGRSISSYSSRVRLQQRQAKQLQPTSPADLTNSNLPALRSALRQPPADKNDDDDDDDGGGGGRQVGGRFQRLEATEEFADDPDEAAQEDMIYGQSADDTGNRYGSKEVAVEKSYGDDGDDGEQKSAGSKLIRKARLVVGGIESMPGEFPYLAALHGGPDEVFFCGGVLISINWLLTAAHCVGNRTQPDGWMVKVGVTRRIASPAFVKKLKVRKIIKHPSFNHESMFNNDIALILLEESVEYNQYLRPICLPRANLKLGPDNSKDCVVVGFGKSKFSQEANYLHVAHFVNVPIVHHAVCSGWYADHGVNLTEGMLCAGYAEGKRDACQGDSGSGLFCRYSNTNQFFVAGVVSFGIKCATPKLPGVYTSVPSYVSWVEQTTRQYGYPL